jgi:hypothetical protein
LSVPLEGNRVQKCGGVVSKITKKDVVLVLTQVSLAVSISRLIAGGNMYFNMGSIKSSNAVPKEGIVFVVAGKSRGEGSIRGREVNDLLVKQENSL